MHLTLHRRSRPAHQHRERSVSKSTAIRWVGSSRDQRTNRWSVTCPACERVFEPETTMRSTQIVQCPAPKCKAEMVARYNDNPPTVSVLEKIELGTAAQAATATPADQEKG